MSTPLPDARPQPLHKDECSHDATLSEPGFDRLRTSRQVKSRYSSRRVRSDSRIEAVEIIENAPSPARGRSTTPKFDRTNGNGGSTNARQAASNQTISWPATNSSVDGQEGLANHQMEHNIPVEDSDQGTHANNSIHHWLAQHHTPSHPYGPLSSPSASMLVEASTVAPSTASSGFLPPRAASSADLLVFASGGFDGGNRSATKQQHCPFTPLWLTHERRYCRNMHLGGRAVVAVGYPGTLEICDGE